MICKNKVSYWVPRGYDYRETLVDCGGTDPHGGRAICDKCASNPAKMAEIRRREEDIEADNYPTYNAEEEAAIARLEREEIDEWDEESAYWTDLEEANT